MSYTLCNTLLQDTGPGGVRTDVTVPLSSKVITSCHVNSEQHPVLVVDVDLECKSTRRRADVLPASACQLYSHSRSVLYSSLRRPLLPFAFTSAIRSTGSTRAVLIATEKKIPSMLRGCRCGLVATHCWRGGFLGARENPRVVHSKNMTLNTQSTSRR